MRVLRILEYEGTPEFVKASLDKRIKGSMVTKNGIIREAILGDVTDFLSCEIAEVIHDHGRNITTMEFDMNVLLSHPYAPIAPAP